MVIFLVILNGKLGNPSLGYSRSPFRESSPFLFILVVDALSQLISTRIDRNLIRGRHVRFKDVVISHLSMIDRVLGFCS